MGCVVVIGSYSLKCKHGFAASHRLEGLAEASRHEMIHVRNNHAVYHAIGMVVVNRITDLIGYEEVPHLQ